MTKTEIHPLIENMKISQKVKDYFNQLEFYEIIEDAIILSSSSHQVNECRENLWSFAVQLKYCNADDILAFHHAIIEGRKSYLLNNNISTKMVFYTWYDPMSGNFYFSLIPQNWSGLLHNQELPFGCALNKVEKLESIIANFINDPYKGRIPKNELKKIDPSEDNKDPKNYILDIWHTVL